MYKLVIFDFDGTIADTSQGIINSVKYVQKKMNLPEITYEQMYSHIGPPMEESYNRNFGLEGDRLKKAVSLHKEYAIQNGYCELKIYDGIPSLLDKIHSMGMYTAIATLKAQTTADKILAEFNITDKFDVVIGTDSDKPMTKAQMLKYCIDMLGCKCSETIFIGDSKYDAEGAEKVGIDFIAVTYGFGFKSDNDISEYSHTAVCQNVNQIEKALSIVYTH